MARVSKKPFTLLEVMVAAFILSVSLIMILQILGTARSRILRAERRWARTHLLEQGLEFHLMAGVDAEFPNEFLPDGFSVVCEPVEVKELPDYANEPINDKILAAIKLTVLDMDDEWVNSFTIEKILPQQ